MKKLQTNSYKQTQELGFDIGKKIKNRTVFALYGNLGSGKTTFVQGLAKGLGIKQKIISPTFIIVRKYEIPNFSLSDPEFTEGESRSRHSGLSRIGSRQARTINFYHIDLYRIENQTELEGLGLEEILNDNSNVVAIEWPEKIEKSLPESSTKIYFEHIEDEKRKIVIHE